MDAIPARLAKRGEQLPTPWLWCSVNAGNRTCIMMRLNSRLARVGPVGFVSIPANAASFHPEPLTYSRTSAGGAGVQEDRLRPAHGPLRAVV
jgi:hypothetical protein